METNMAAILDAAAQQTQAVPAPVQPQTESVQTEEANLALKLRAQELMAQARTIRVLTNVDVLALYNTDVEIRARVLTGEWDFIDVWNLLRPAAQPPAPVRSANGGAGAVSIGAMNETQFHKLNEMLSKGAKVDMR